MLRGRDTHIDFLRLLRLVGMIDDLPSDATQAAQAHYLLVRASEVIWSVDCEQSPFFRVAICVSRVLLDGLQKKKETARSLFGRNIRELLVYYLMSNKCKKS